MSQLHPETDRRADCAFCKLVYETYPKFDGVENQSTSEIIQCHVRVAHGVRMSSLSTVILPWLLAAYAVPMCSAAVFRVVVESAVATSKR
jgi:hypothetical protein